MNLGRLMKNGLRFPILWFYNFQGFLMKIDLCFRFFGLNSSPWNYHFNLFLRLGDIVSKEKPNFHFLFKSADLRTFMPPSTYFQKWTNDNRFLKREGLTVWEASCPENYRALGNLITVNKPFVIIIFQAFLRVLWFSINIFNPLHLTHDQQIQEL